MRNGWVAVRTVTALRRGAKCHFKVDFESILDVKNHVKGYLITLRSSLAHHPNHHLIGQIGRFAPPSNGE